MNLQNVSDKDRAWESINLFPRSPNVTVAQRANEPMHSNGPDGQPCTCQECFKKWAESHAERSA